MNNRKILMNGILKENSIFVMLLGMCPTLGVTTSAENGLGMGLATTFVLIMSNIVISLIKKYVSDKIRIPAFIFIAAAFTTILEMLMQAYFPALFETLGLFIPLIAVNCIILGRAEAFASKNSVASSVVDGVGIGMGFAIALTILGSVREILGNGKLFGFQIYSEDYGILVFVLAPGAFFALGYVIALISKLNKT